VQWPIYSCLFLFMFILLVQILSHSKKHWKGIETELECSSYIDSNFQLNARTHLILLNRIDLICINYRRPGDGNWSRSSGINCQFIRWVGCYKAENVIKILKIKINIICNIIDQMPWFIRAKLPMLWCYEEMH